MKITKDDVQALITQGVLNIDELGKNKGSVVIFYKGKLLYAWIDHDRLALQGKWPWNRKILINI
jgi:hypothetical protein